MNRSEVLAELVTLIETADANDKTIAEAIYDAGFRKAGATTCPGHGRSECVSCCWPKGELEGKRADRMVFDEKSRIGELANLLTLAKAHVPITDPLRGLINANLMQHLVEQDPWADFKDAAPVPAGYTAVDMGTAAADGYRSAWIPAENPPNGEVGKWSRRVVAVTNADNAFAVSYFHGGEGGVWQRPKAMADGEQFIKWSEIPG